MCYAAQVIEECIVAKMGWTEASLAGPQPISLRGQERAAGRVDGVEATAEPLSGPHWTIDYEGRRNVSITDHNQYRGIVP